MGLIQNEGFLKDLESADFSAILNKNVSKNPDFKSFCADYESGFEDDFEDDFEDEEVTLSKTDDK